MIPYLILFGLIILLMFLTYSNKNIANEEHFETLLNTSNKIKLQQCMLAFHELCNQHDLWYIIAFGTLLGAVRHHGIIPWDDDIDLLVYRTDMVKLNNILDKMNELGYKIEKTWKLYRIYVDEKHFIDLFFVEEHDNKILRCQDDINKCIGPSAEHEWWWKWFNFPKSFIAERKVFKFDGLSLYGPVHPTSILKYWYGDDCLTVCKTPELVNHGAEMSIPQVKPCENLPEPQL